MSGTVKNKETLWNLMITNGMLDKLSPSMSDDIQSHFETAINDVEQESPYKPLVTKNKLVLQKMVKIIDLSVKTSGVVKPLKYDHEQGGPPPSIDFSDKSDAPVTKSEVDLAIENRTVVKEPSLIPLLQEINRKQDEILELLRQ